MMRFGTFEDKEQTTDVTTFENLLASKWVEKEQGTSYWNCQDLCRDFYQVLEKANNCVVRIVRSSGTRPIEFQFRFRKYEEKEERPQKSGCIIREYISLEVELVSADSTPLPIRVIISEYDQYEQVATLVVTKERVVTFSQSRNETAFPKFLFLSYTTFEFNRLTNMTNTGFTEPKKNYCAQDRLHNYRITVILLKEEEFSAASSLDHNQVLAESPLYRDIRNMFNSQENFPDVKLETKDFMTISAHRFIMAARSPYLAKMLTENADKRDGYSGVVRLDSANGKPLLALLHWMYTDEMPERVDNFLEEVVQLAMQFEMPDLLQVLDKRLITVCSIQNMFKIYQVAEKYNLETAFSDVTAFIKENVGQPNTSIRK